jgi:hypothetical protein
MSDISKWTRLKVLKIFTGGTGKVPLPINLDILLNLPKSLRELWLSIYESTLQSDHLEALPKDLRILSLDPILQTSRTFKTSNECFAKLPRSVTQLQIPKNANITAAILEYLPPSVIYIMGPAILIGAQKKFFDRHWEGYGP